MTLVAPNTKRSHSCADCIGANGNLTGYHNYQLDHDARLRMGFMSTKQDGVVLERLPLSPEAYEAEQRGAQYRCRSR